MKATKKTVKKVLSRQHIKEALSYWRGRLAQINENEDGSDEIDEADEEDEEDEGDDGDEGGRSTPPDADSAEGKAAANPIGDFDLASRMYRIHVKAQEYVEKALGKLLNRAKVGDNDSVQVENSYIKGNNYAPDDGEPMIIKMRIQLDRAKVKNFRKFWAVVSENEKNLELDEASIWKAMIGAAKQAGQEKIDDANKALKLKIGVAGMQEYVKRFCGIKLAKKVSLKNVFFGADEEGAGAELTFCSAINVED